MMTPFQSLKENKHSISIAPSTIGLVTLAIVGMVFIYHIWSILVLLFLSFIVMTALHPGVDALVKRLRIPRPMSIFIVYVIAISSFLALLGLILPPLGVQLYQMAKNINMPFPQEQLTDIKFTLLELSSFAQQVGTSVTTLLSIISSTFSGLFTVFTLVIMSYYLMLDRPNLYKKIAWFTQEEKHLKLAADFLDSVEKQLGGWIRGQILLMLIMGFVTYAGLLLLGIPYALPLALLAGMLEILPNLGPTIAAIPAVVLGYLVGGPVIAGLLIIFYVVIQQLENGIIVPRVMKANADVNPLVSISAILIGLEIGGVVGAILGIPAYILLRAFYGTWLKTTRS